MGNRFFVGLRNGLIISLVLWVLIFFAVKCFAQEVIKVDDNTLKTTTEKVYTYEEIQNRIDQLKSERDGQQNNLNLLNAEIARLEKMIQDTGITAKPDRTTSRETNRIEMTTDTLKVNGI